MTPKRRERRNVQRGQKHARLTPCGRASPSRKSETPRNSSALFDANVEFVLIGGAAMQIARLAHLTEDRIMLRSLVKKPGTAGD